MWGAIIGGVLGLGKMAYGAYQAKKAKDAAGKAPTFSISDQYYNNVGLAQSELSQGGFSADALSALYQANQQNLAASTNAILQSGGGANDIASLYRNAAQANAALALPDQQLRMAKVQNLMENRLNLAGQEIIQWRTNQYNRWKDKAQAAAMLGAMGNQNIMSGLDQFGASAAQVGNYASQNSVNKQLKQMQKQNQFGGSGYRVDAMGGVNAGYDEATFDNWHHNVDNIGNPASPEFPTLAQMQTAFELESPTSPYAYNSYNNFNNLPL